MRSWRLSTGRKRATASTSRISFRPRAPWFILAADLCRRLGDLVNMADEEAKYFSLTEAERLRTQLEPILIDAMESRRKLGEAEEELNALAERIQRSGGLMVSYERAARTRLERN